MESNGNKGILVVSFGTSYEETRKKTIDRIEADIQAAYPDYRVYRAWTSKIIMKKLLKRDGLRILNVKEALEQMHQDGIREVAVQPTHVINGIEYDLLAEDVKGLAHLFDRVVMGTPLLTHAEDSRRVIEAIMKEQHPAEDEALVFMGHGTEHFANSIYAALDYQFKDMGYKNVFMGTVEAYPGLDTLMKYVRETGLRKVVLAPFMIVAGDHATNDLSGDEEDSWKSMFERDGYQVRCELKGLGEYEAIRRIFVEHVADALNADK